MVQSTASNSVVPSKLLKRNPIGTSDNVPSLQNVSRAPSMSGVRRVVGEELRRELAPPARKLPTSANVMKSLPQPHMNPSTTSRITRLESARTPSLVSGSSASEFDSPRSNLLRKKPSHIGSRKTVASVAKLSDRKATQSAGIVSNDPHPNAVLGVSMPPVPFSQYSDGTEDIIDLDRYITTPPPFPVMDLPHPTPLYAQSSTPSTGYSPGPFSISSTPSSMSSASPGLVAPVTLKTTTRVRQPSPTRSRPPPTRKMTDDMTSSLDAQGLPSVRESSSSSVSTLREGEYGRPRDRSRVREVPPQLQSPHNRKPALQSPGHARQEVKIRQDATPRIHPEFAHLADTSPRRDAVTGRPLRPSRDNTPDMSIGQLSSIVQSNMSSLPSAPHKRQVSFEKSTLHKRQTSSTSQPLRVPLTIDTKPRFGSSRGMNPTPSPSSASALSPMTNRFTTRGFTPEITNENEKISKTRPSPTVEPKQSRFGFFSRKKTAEANSVPAPRSRKERKGPAAGTGHEGYGRFAIRGRSGSTTSGSGNTSADRSPSTDSTIGNTRPASRKSSIGSKAGSDMDDFFADRLQPITLRGSGSSVFAIERSLTNESQNRYIEHAPQEPKPAAGPRMSNEMLKPSLLPSPIFEQGPSGPPSRRPSKADSKSPIEEQDREFDNSAAPRRASRMSFLGGKTAKVTVAEGPTDSTQKSSLMAGKLSKQIANPKSVPLESRTGKPSRSARAETDSKAQLKVPRKWGFLQRARSPTRKEPRTSEAAVFVPLSHTPKRTIAHYAMSEASESIDADELEKILLEAESVPDEPSCQPEMTRRPSGNAPRHGNSILLPEPPTFMSELAGPQRPSSPKVTLKSRMASPQAAQQSPPASGTPVQPQQPTISIVGKPRPSRLAPVGRIPRVVSKRDRERKLSDSSFSRPFMVTQPSPALKNGFLSEPLVASPEMVEPRVSEDLVMATASQDYAQTDSNDHSTQPSSINGSGEFFRFPPRKDSEQSTTSSSSGLLNLLTTAVVPEANAPPGVDEVWNEYDDLLDLLSSKTPKTPKTPLTGSSLGSPFQYSGYVATEPVAISKASDDVDQPDDPVPSMASIAERLRMPSMHDPRLLGTPLPSATTPGLNSPFRMSDFVAGYGERNLSVLDPVSGRFSLPSSARLSSSTTRHSLPISTRPASQQAPPKKRSSICAATPLVQQDKRTRDSRLIDIAEKEQLGMETVASLRFGALMTSKWLSFGRVLFSPVHFEIKDPAQDRVLILDGLGKDWSYYVALTYPKATIYSLGADLTESGGSPFESLPNHRHFHHPSLSAPFPFPKGFFAAVVFRFPVATNEAAYRSSLMECKRVLRPGGYLELSVLDMDMMNMGSRARAALRGLKMQMQAEEHDISLKPIGDTIQKLLGRRGFENINRCLVGVPAAGRIPSSVDGSANGEPVSASTAESSNASTLVGSHIEDMSSFGDLMTGQSKNDDEGITKMVARVGRWWYSRCYESPILPNGDITQSIWNDPALIRECEKRGTNLKLMVCFAQKPDCPVRRTISV
ncbi:hypothetical protein FKW77_006717 [Venturia effusa]|uniref:Methyltransferase type 11 domain-containing protein n=1 Tax=Venturia effusa TaxID=50376 RepID=A0A517L5Q4_9PEZI|nr:hypothetical protein FKW77_006717 [Venturia effusa]